MRASSDWVLSAVDRPSDDGVGKRTECSLDLAACCCALLVVCSSVGRIFAAEAGVLIAPRQHSIASNCSKFEDQEEERS